ncbi:MAG: sigma 54-interacting transcriptional regulator [Thermoguttaceae bacterium]|nr:sigma 54-interacting transcriptional regulator [Thermoguttaceae bacterium]
MDGIRKEIAVLREISSVVLHERVPERLLDHVLEILSSRMGMLRATFTLRQGDIFRIEASHGLDETEKRRGEYRFGEGITGRVAASGKPQLVPDISKDRRFLNRTGSHKANEHLAFLCVPVLYHEGIIGTLSMECPTATKTELEANLELLEIIGNLTAEAVAVRHAEHEEHQMLTSENERLRRAIRGVGNPGQLIGNCRNMQAVYQLIRQVAPTDATVLIRGETGTGKELVATAIHQLSPRHEAPLISLNCAALPEALVESELFGYEKGAFTGASSRRIGRVEAADGGTLFLDEIGDLNPASQVKLLRFLQERTFSRIGSNEELRSDVRVIAATSRNLEMLIAEKQFREDLYYRLNVFPIHIPSLNRRKCDIVLLAEHFIEKYNLRHRKSIKKLSTPTVNMLMNYPWPGNVRELENCIERAVLTATGDSIRSYNLPPSLQTSEEASAGLDIPHSDEPDELDVYENVDEVGKSGETELGTGTDSTDFRDRVDTFERELIVSALREHHGNMSAAARQLNLSPRVIHYKINRLHIHPEAFTLAEPHE